VRSEIVDTLPRPFAVPAGGDDARVKAQEEPADGGGPSAESHASAGSVEPYSGETLDGLCLTTSPVVVVSAAFVAYSITGAVTQT
jgi:hypothetical protein